MNDTAAKLEARAAEKKRVESIVHDFQAAEPVLIKEAEELMCAMVRKHFPSIQGIALQSGYMKGKLTIEVLFDLTPKKKGVEVRGLIQPPPITSMERKDIRY